MLLMPAGVRMPPESLSTGTGLLCTGGVGVAAPSSDNEVAERDEVVEGCGCAEPIPAEVVAWPGAFTEPDVVGEFEALVGVAAPVASIEETAGFGLTAPGLGGNLLTGAESLVRSRSRQRCPDST